jgi:hypothetical protein
MNTIKTVVTSLVLAAFAALAQPAAAHSDHYADADIDRLLAPVALYPDTVLSHVLIAATYPDDVHAAARWSRNHPKLSGEDAVEAVDGQDWDPSVKALVAFPELLARMDEDGEWTEHLGDAFAKQEGGVMDRVQYLRQRAYDAGTLNSLEHVRVVREREYIYIEPAVTEIIYVPYYDPWYAYGTWWWPAYPPYYWHTWYGRPRSYYRTGFYWGIGFPIAPRFYFTTFYWPQRYVVVSHDYRRPIYSSRDVSGHRDVRRWSDSPQRASSDRRERRATPQARGDVKADTRVERRPREDSRRERRSDTPGHESRGRDRQDVTAPRTDRGSTRSDEVRERLRERRDATPRRESSDRPGREREPRAEVPGGDNRRGERPRADDDGVDHGRGAARRAEDAPDQARDSGREARGQGDEEGRESRAPGQQRDEGREARGNKRDTRGNRRGGDREDGGREKRGQRDRN